MSMSFLYAKSGAAAMSTPAEPSRSQEYPNTYFVQDRSSLEELKRLQIQDQLVTASMGGVLPEQSLPMSFERVLDVGCGTGGWLISMAQTFPTASLLIGVDASGKMISFARSQAEAQGVADRIEFHMMDALQMLEFPAGFFDLVNQRSAVSWIRTWEWPKLLNEYQRISRPDGIVRITEPEILVTSPSSALAELFELMLTALFQSGHLFTPENDGLTSHLTRLLSQAGFKDVQARVSTLEYHAGTPEGYHAYEDARYLFRTIVPFLQKWTRLPDKYESIYQQAMHDMQQPGFFIISRMLTAWGKNVDSWRPSVSGENR
jgi:ubiquinone/menaquinone biosynthesis C-methylase UbiE